MHRQKISIILSKYVLPKIQWISPKSSKLERRKILSFHNYGKDRDLHCYGLIKRIDESKPKV